MARGVDSCGVSRRSVRCHVMARGSGDAESGGRVQCVGMEGCGVGSGEAGGARPCCNYVHGRSPRAGRVLARVTKNSMSAMCDEDNCAAYVRSLPNG